MQALKNDVVTYKVCFQDKNKKLQTIRFDSFAKASGMASALINTTRFINVEFRSPEGDSAWSGSLYVYSKDDNSRRPCSQSLIAAVTKHVSENEV